MSIYSNSLFFKSCRIGIYRITNLVNEKVYIGQTTNFRTRWNNHKSLLKRNKHDNVYLQHSWNKNGQENFIFEILEICEKTLLNEIENKWLDYYQAGNNKVSYNILKFSENSSSKPRANDFSFTSPKGDVFSGRNIAEFSTEHDLCEKSMQALARGRSITHKGWRLTKEKRTSIYLNRNSTVLVSPDNVEYSGNCFHNGFSDFAEKMNLNPRLVHFLVERKIKIYKGWRLKENKEYSSKISHHHLNPSYVKNKKTQEIFGPISNIKSFCESQNINSKCLSSFYKMLKGHRKSACGFILSKEI